MQVMVVDGFAAQKGDDEMEKLPDNLTNVIIYSSGASQPQKRLFSPTPPPVPPSRQSPIFVGHPLSTSFN
jgi:hypothetical protein